MRSFEKKERIERARRRRSEFKTGSRGFLYVSFPLSLSVEFFQSKKSREERGEDDDENRRKGGHSFFAFIR